MVHELKNPLMIIGGFTNQIHNAMEDEPVRQKLHMMLEEIARVERLVGSLGDFIREYRLTRREADVNSVLQDVVRYMGAAYPPDKVSFVESLHPELGEITCDPDKLKQVFINIISNGIEAMGQTGVISLVSEPTAHGIEVRISDQGGGIPEEDLQHIFEPFFTTRERGSGLGLAISYKIIQAHAGELSAVNRPGKGATFVIRLPPVLKAISALSKSKSGSLSKSNRHGQGPEPTDRPMTLLLAQTYPEAVEPVSVRPSNISQK